MFTSGMTRGRLLPFFIPNELILVASAALAFPAIMLQNQRQRIPAPIFTGIAFLAIGGSILPTLIYLQRGVSLSTSDLFGIIAPVQYIVLFLVVLFLTNDERDRQRLIQWMLFCAAIVAIIGLLQAFNVGPVRSFLTQWYPSIQLEQSTERDINRVTSLMGAWNSLGTFMMINLLVIIAIFNKVRHKWFRRNMIFVGLVCLACLLATSSWASLVSLVLGYFLIKGVRGIRPRNILILLGVMAVAAVLLQPLIEERLEFQFGSGDSIIPQTLTYRIRIWQDFYIPLLERNFVSGVSPNFAGVTFGYAENQYLFLLYRSGLASLVGHLVWVTLAVIWLRQKFQNSQDFLRVLALVTLVIFVLLSIMGMTNPVFTYSGSIEYLWIFLALIVSSERGKTLSTGRS